jgi:hypothetical protein
MKRARFAILSKSPWKIMEVRFAPKATAKHSSHVFSCLGGNLNAASRQALMQKLARTEQAPTPIQEV